MRCLLPPILWALSLAAIPFLVVYWPIGVILPAPFHWSGVALLLLGGWLLVSASGQFRRVKTNISTFRDPNILVTTGAFALTRNPMYLGFVLTLLGAALVSNLLSALLVPLAFFLIANAWYVPFEERAAAAQFGEAYATYKARVRRWL